MDDEKRLAAAAALRFVRSGMKLGLGSGSTSRHFIKLLGEQVRAGALAIEAVASSRGSEQLAAEVGITVGPPRRGLRLDLTIDGADEIGPDLTLIKGGGGALLREKVVARASRAMLVLADSSKPVDRLGTFPLPLEVVPFALPWVCDEIERLGGTPILRINPAKQNEPVLTDQGNQLLDCHFTAADGTPGIVDPAALAARLEAIPGVVEHGLFLGYAKAALVADAERVLLLRPGQAAVAATGFESLP